MSVSVRALLLGIELDTPEEDAAPLRVISLTLLVIFVIEVATRMWAMGCRWFWYALPRSPIYWVQCLIDAMVQGFWREHL